MVDISLQIIVMIFLLGFLAAFFDSVVGGGGLISVPALLLTGLPVPVVLGTNKLASTMSSLTSTITFARSGKIDYSVVKYLIPFSLTGAVLGTYTVRHVPVSLLKPAVIVLLIGVTLYTLLKKDWGSISTYAGLTNKTRALSILAAFAIGFYDGFFGPGTGSFLIFAFLFLGFDFVTAAGNAKVLNFTSNAASLMTFILMGSVNYMIGIIMGVAMIAGALVGSRLAIRKGSSYIRPLFIMVTILLIGKQAWDSFH
ncbi:TSUP family transporter [Paenibacillus tarimensis]|uniref:TSUP family transporter n=1 Tax=Paenibacillus tarimensis TaxID=416012 RepID=UPI001F328E0D|nr:TSUP family transporter [Paenibacillus tarimensis]MCF2943059.1 TSUP family transporter [Paenibacillus tarimensis]